MDKAGVVMPPAFLKAPAGPTLIAGAWTAGYVEGFKAGHVLGCTHIRQSYEGARRVVERRHEGYVYSCRYCNSFHVHGETDDGNRRMERGRYQRPHAGELAHLAAVEALIADSGQTDEGK